MESTSAGAPPPTATCRAREVDPFAYLRDVLDRVCTHPARRVADLLPDHWKIHRPLEVSRPG